MDWSDIADVPLNEQVSRFHLGYMPGLEARIRTSDPENRWALSLRELLVMFKILFENRFTEFFISLK
jgi:hypothetical protein